MENKNTTKRSNCCVFVCLLFFGRRLLSFALVVFCTVCASNVLSSNPQYLTENIASQKMSKRLYYTIFVLMYYNLRRSFLFSLSLSLSFTHAIVSILQFYGFYLVILHRYRHDDKYPEVREGVNYVYSSLLLKFFFVPICFSNSVIVFFIF